MENRVSVPHNIEAEQAILGAMLISNDAVITASEQLTEFAFYYPSHQMIFGTISGIHLDGTPIDITTVSAALKERGELDKAGGVSYLYELINSVPTAANVEYYINIVEKEGLRRQLIEATMAINKGALTESEDIEELLQQAEQKILQVANNRRMGQFERIDKVLNQTIDYIESLKANAGSVTGLKTAFRDLDKMTAGLQRGDLIIVGARPSMGKTAFALNIARNVALHNDGASVAIFSLEMSAQQLVMRMLSAEARVEAEKLRNGQLTNQDWSKLSIGTSILGKTNVFIDDTPGLTIQEIRSKTRRLKNEKGLDLIIIDYLQLIHAHVPGNSRQEEVSYISRSLKALARELEVPVIALSQLSRAVESRQEKKPIMSDIRESGSIEQDADIVAFLYREDYYDRDSEKDNIIEIIIGKQRNGPVGSVELAFIKEFNRFEDLTQITDGYVPPSV
ncbi:replicative DNA helicase [Culicoidibacter larvae]|uniref:Replicative DNA helicase n=1 Tax=Culicoidibacter larvae TaxID=2579976 RepID=A0A5R8QJL9_9FIRM|nr:replicative DNA helicase [Culicoidibacter larvae]TLG77457.1 replicative DNA helicase [Culicoidibacter larvae]